MKKIKKRYSNFDEISKETLNSIFRNTNGYVFATDYQNLQDQTKQVSSYSVQDDV